MFLSSSPHTPVFYLTAKFEHCSMRQSKVMSKCLETDTIFMWRHIGFVNAAVVARPTTSKNLVIFLWNLYATYLLEFYTVYYLREKISISSFNRYLNALQERLQHVEWDRFGAVGLRQFFALTYLEGKFCSTGKWSCNGHKKCKRKICALCGDRIKLQKRTLEVSSQSWVSWNFGVLHLRVIYLFPSEC